MSDQLKPSDFQITLLQRVSRIEYDRMPDYILHDMEMNMIRKISNDIVNRKVKPEVLSKLTDDFVEKKLDLCVATPAEFWKLVNQEARKLSYSPIPFLPEKSMLIVYILMERVKHERDVMVSIHSTQAKAEAQIEVELGDLISHFLPDIVKLELIEARKNLYIKKIIVDPEGVQMP